MHSDPSNAPCVSVIVAAYNVETYIEECLRSLQRQTLESIQLIIVDDGSTDATPELIKAMAQHEGHALEYIRQENGGLSAARNTGMAAATGEFIGFVDGDDWVSPDMFEKLYDKAVQTDSEVVVCAGLKRSGQARRGRIMLRIPEEEFGVSVADNPEILWGAHSYAWNKIYARSLIERESFEFPYGKLFEDSSAVYGLIASANRVAAVDEALYQYRVGRPEAITRRADPRIYDIFDSCDSFRQSLGPLDEASGDTDVVERLARTHLLARFPALRSSRSPVRAAAFSGHALKYMDTHFPGWRSRYERGSQSRARYYSRRNTALAVLASFLTPIHFTVRSELGRRSAPMRSAMIGALAARRVDDAFRAAGIPYILDLSSLAQANDHQPLARRLEISVLPCRHDIVEIAILLRQQRFGLVRSYMHGEECIAQRWQLRRRFVGNVVVELRFLDMLPDGMTRTRFFFRGSDSSDNTGSIAELRAPPPGRVVDRRLPRAGTVRAVERSDPFAATRTSAEFAPPRNFEQLAAEIPEMEIDEGAGSFYDGLPPAVPETVGLARAEQMDVLTRFLDFCETNGLEPMLGDGSLLGAVRHGGYIPWDDDIDLWMTREHFDRLVAMDLPEGLVVMHHTTNPSFHLGFAKIVRLDSAFEWGYPVDLEPSGTNIDVFPLDWSSSPERLSERVRARLVRLIRQIIRTKYRFPETKRPRRRVVLGWMLSGYAWQRVLHRIVVTRPLGPKSNLTSWFSAYPASRASYPAHWILPTKPAEFEGQAVAVPADPERVLNRTYNDFLALPPPSRRTTANHFMKLREDHR